MRVVFMGSPPFATPVFEALASSAHTTLALVTQPDRPRGRGRKVEASPLVETARARGLAVHQPAGTKDPAFVAELRALEPDVLLVASYGEILRRDVLDLPRLGAWNVHASLLPRHRGASPIQAAILAGDDETGVCVQRMVLALDEGDVITARATPIGAHENAGELLARLARIGADVALEALDMIARGDVRTTPQDPARATYARKIQKEHGLVDWTRSALEIERLVRAFSPWPGARATAPNGVELTLHDVRAESARDESAPAGTLLELDPLRIATHDGVVRVLALQPAGKARMDAASWTRGARLSVGTRFDVARAEGGNA